jgi:hypothetical protein
MRLWDNSIRYLQFGVRCVPTNNQCINLQTSNYWCGGGIRPSILPPPPTNNTSTNCTLLCDWNLYVPLPGPCIANEIWLKRQTGECCYVEFQVVTAVVMQIVIFWDIKPCAPLKVNQKFGVTYCLHFEYWMRPEDRGDISSKTIVDFQWTTLRFVEDSTLQKWNSFTLYSLVIC